MCSSLTSPTSKKKASVLSDHFSHRWVNLKLPAIACGLRARMVHVVPPAVQLASAMLQVVLKYAYVMDPSTGQRLLTWKTMKTTMKQIRLVLNNGLSGEFTNS